MSWLAVWRVVLLVIIFFAFWISALAVAFFLATAVESWLNWRGWAGIPMFVLLAVFVGIFVWPHVLSAVSRALKDLNKSTGARKR